MNARRLCFWLLLFLFAAGTLVWLLWVPYAPWRLYAAVPPEASFVSAHADPAGRWKSLSENPLARSLLSTIGLEPPRIDALSSNASFQVWLRRLASDQVVVAYVPPRGVEKEAWVLASWIGGRSQRLRWMLAWRNPLGVKYLGRHGGRALWGVQEAWLRGSPAVSFALAEGMLVACVSQQPGMIRRVLDELDHRGRDARKNHPGLACGSPGAADRGWLRTPGLGEESRWAFALSVLGPDRIEGRLCGSDGGAGEGDWVHKADWAGLADVLGNAPLALWGFSRRAASDWLADHAWMRWARALAGALERDGGPGMVVVALGEAYSSRLRGIRWPGLVLCVALRDEFAAPAAAHAYLDELNAAYRWGLIPRERTVSNRPLFVVEGTAETPYAELSEEERVAYAVCGRWLLVGSSAETLATLLGRYDEPQASGEEGTPRWLARLPSGRCRGFGWLDLAEGGRILRLALTAYALKLGTEDPYGTRDTRQRIQEVKSWIDALAPLRECRWTVAEEKGGLRVDFEVGAERAERREEGQEHHGSTRMGT